MIKRCDKILQGYEDKLHLLQRFMSVKEKIQKIESITAQDDVRDLANQILEEL